MKRKTLFFPILLIFAVYLFSTFVVAQPKEKQVKWIATLDKKDIIVGEKFDVKVNASINFGWHLYSTTTPKEGAQPTKFKIKDNKNFKIFGKIKQSTPITKFEEVFGANTEYYEDKAEFIITLFSDELTPKGIQDITLIVEYMMCNNQFCLPPVEDQIKVTINVIKKEKTPLDTIGTTNKKNDTIVTSEIIKTDSLSGSIIPPEISSGISSELEKAKSEGLLSFIGFAMMMGALALLTPCVFPMIPITVSFFTKREQKTKLQGVKEALLYSIGIIITFVLLGFLLAIILGASGVNQFASNPWVNLVIAVIFLLFALNLFGLFEIGIPSSILTKLNQKSSGGGVVSILLMGLTFSLASFTCTVPFIGTILVAAAKGDFLWPIIGMLAYSTIFSLPFFLLALFPMFLKSLPKSGAWMNSIKIVMGFLVLAALMKFISNADMVWGWNLFNHDFYLSIWIAISLLITFYLLGKFRFALDTPIENIGVIRLFFSILFFSLSIYLFTGLLGNNLGEIEAFLPTKMVKTNIYNPNTPLILGDKNLSDLDNLKWYSNYSEALNAAKQENKNIFIDFNGFTCTNCKWMKANILNKPPIVNLLSHFVLVSLYTDGQGEEYRKNRKMQEDRFGTIALPFYVIMNREDRVISYFPGLTRNLNEFETFLRKGIP